MPTLLMKESIALIAITISDLVSTVWLIASGRCTEMNPIMNYLLQVGWGPFVFFKLLTIVTAVGICEWYRRRNEGFARKWVRIGIGSYLFVWCFWFTIGNFR